MDEHARLIERIKAAVRLLYPDDMTPNAKRVLETILRDEEERVKHGD